MDTLPNEILQVIMSLMYKGMTTLERQSLRFALQKLNRRWHDLTQEQEPSAVVNTASKAERLAKTLKRDQARATGLIRLELQFSQTSQNEKTWLSENKWSLLLRQCRLITQLIIKMDGTFDWNKTFNNEVYDAFARLHQLQSFTVIGHCGIPELKSRTFERSVTCLVRKYQLHSSTLSF